MICVDTMHDAKIEKESNSVTTYMIYTRNAHDAKFQKVATFVLLTTAARHRCGTGGGSQIWNL